MRRAMLLAVSALLLLGKVAVVRAAVTLLYFRAKPSSTQIVLEWETATEYNTTGFVVKRYVVPISPNTTPVSSFFPALGEGILGAFYSYTDTTVSSGALYYYELDEITSAGISNSVASVTVTAGLATPTPTATSTTAPVDVMPTARTPRPTETPTPTETSVPDALYQPTVTPNLANSRTPAPTNSGPTATPSRTSTLMPTQSAATPVPPGMVAVTTATAAALATSAQATSGKAVTTALPVVEGVRVTSVAGKLPVVTNTPRPAILSQAQPSPASTQVARLSSPLAAEAQSGAPADSSLGAIPGGTNWFVVGLGIGMFAVAVILAAGAVYLIRMLLRW